MKTGCFMVLVMSSCVFSDAPESVSGKVGDSVLLHTGVTKQQHHIILWRFNDTRIALINGDANKSCLYYGEGGIFRDRLEVDYETGSLTITNITAEHAGRYEARIIRSESAGINQSLNRMHKCDGTKVIRKKNLGYTIKTYNVSVSGPEKPNESTNEGRQDPDKNTLSDSLAVVVASVCVFAAVIVIAAVAVICCRQKNTDTRAGNGKHNEVV